MFNGLVLVPKIKYCLTINEVGNLEEHETFEGFNDSKQLLDHSRYCEMIEGKNKSALIPKSWKKSFSGGVIIPAKTIL